MNKFVVSGAINQSFEIEVEAENALEALDAIAGWPATFDERARLKDRSMTLTSAEEIEEDV